MSFAKIRPRRGTATQWATANPVLAEGELAFEVPTEGVGTGVVKVKIGDGVTAWNELPYGLNPLNKEDIVDNLESESVELPLSANQGRVLNQSKAEKPILLWENPTPTYTFSAQNITLASDDYDYLDIYWLVTRKGVGAGDIVLCEKTIKGYSSLLRLVSHMDSIGYYMFSRTISYVNDTTLNFSDAVCSIENVTPTPNIYNVPIKIYGGKF